MQSSDEAAAQTEAIALGQRAALKHAAVPLWYWASTGILLGLLAFAAATGEPIFMSVSLIVVLLVGKLSDVALDRIKGIRIGRVIGGIATWLVAPWAISLLGVYVLARTAISSTDQWWAGALCAVLAIPVTVAFGLGYDQIRLRPPQDVASSRAWTA